jgi:hypothetical protein
MKKRDAETSKWLRSGRTSSARRERLGFSLDLPPPGRRLCVEGSNGSRNQLTQLESGHID